MGNRNGNKSINKPFHGLVTRRVITEEVTVSTAGLACEHETLYRSFKDCSTYVVVLYPNQNLYDWSGNLVATGAEFGTVLLVDRLELHQSPLLGSWFVCDGYVRQRFDFTKDEAEIYPDYWDRFDCGSISSTKRLRDHCESRGAEIIAVPGEVTPLHRRDEVLVEAFNMSGTSYFIVPASAWEQIKTLAE